MLFPLIAIIIELLSMLSMTTLVNSRITSDAPCARCCRIESGGGGLGSVNSNLERHARQDHLVRITRGNGCQGAQAVALCHLVACPRYHLGACPATT